MPRDLIDQTYSITTLGNNMSDVKQVSEIEHLINRAVSNDQTIRSALASIGIRTSGTLY